MENWQEKTTEAIHSHSKEVAEVPMLLQTPANFKTEKKKIITASQFRCPGMQHFILSLLYSSNLSQFSYTVFKTKSSTVTSPGRESCPPIAAETSGKQQPMVPAVFFRLPSVRGAALLPGFCSPLKCQCSKQYFIRLYIPAQQGAPVPCKKYYSIALLAVILRISP